jgi:hypothetical protein
VESIYHLLNALPGPNYKLLERDWLKRWLTGTAIEPTPDNEQGRELDPLWPGSLEESLKGLLCEHGKVSPKKIKAGGVKRVSNEAWMELYSRYGDEKKCLDDKFEGNNICKSVAYNESRRVNGCGGFGSESLCIECQQSLSSEDTAAKQKVESLAALVKLIANTKPDKDCKAGFYVSQAWYNLFKKEIKNSDKWFDVSSGRKKVDGKSKLTDVLGALMEHSPVDALKCTHNKLMPTEALRDIELSKRGVSEEVGRGTRE